jgi:hypothetical protein
MTLEFTVGINIAGERQSVTVSAEDALIAALKVKHEKPEAMINYVRRSNRRGDRRHPHKSVGARGWRMPVVRRAFFRTPFGARPARSALREGSLSNHPCRVVCKRFNIFLPIRQFCSMSVPKRLPDSRSSGSER